MTHTHAHAACTQEEYDLAAQGSDEDVEEERRMARLCGRGASRAAVLGALQQAAALGGGGAAGKAASSGEWGQRIR